MAWSLYWWPTAASQTPWSASPRLLTLARHTLRALGLGAGLSAPAAACGGAYPPVPEFRLFGACMILYFAADLLWASKIKGAADAIGIPARPVRSIEMLEARLADSPVRALMVDLDAPEIALKLINRLRSHTTDPRDRQIVTLAFGPHVATDAFEAAKAAGADRVLPRGALARGLHDWLHALGAGQVDRKGLIVEE